MQLLGRFFLSAFALGLVLVNAPPPASAAAAPSGTVVAWGDNGWGSLGDGSETRQQLTPVHVVGVSGVVALAAGDQHSLALKSDGTVWSWGRNLEGQLGIGSFSFDRHATPVQVPGLTGVTAIAAVQWHSLALKSDGTVAAWGSNTSGQLGDGTTVPRATPVAVLGLTDVAAIATGSGFGSAHSLALRKDGTVMTWGGVDGPLPMPVSGLAGVTAVAAGWDYSIALKRDGTVMAWGRGYGQAPVAVDGLTDVTAIAAALDHSLARRNDGSVIAWGRSNLFGELGRPPSYPDPIPGLHDVVAVAANSSTGRSTNFDYSVALKRDGSVAAWGANASGQLGSGMADINHHGIPLHVRGIRGATAIAAGGTHVLAIVTAPIGDSSLGLDGVAGYAEAGVSPDLNLTGDWTIELWFKDDITFNHPYTTLLNKGDREAAGESPYFVTLGFKRLLVGQRTNWVDYTLAVDLWERQLEPGRWHHLATTFERASRTVTVYLDGQFAAAGQLDGVSAGNNLPVEIGRNGRQSSKYFDGRIDDVRIWNTARNEFEIAEFYRTELGAAPLGLVANWTFNEVSGTTSADLGGRHAATLNGGASFSTDVHP